MVRNAAPRSAKRRAVPAEDRRLEQHAAGDVDWRLWGTYLAERQWGTVREDDSEDGNPWNACPYDEARRRAYRWGEDGLLGWTDAQCRLCFSTALWNGRDPHLKDRLFGLSNDQGNHGEDVKELYYHVDATPTGSYAKALYRYPQAPFPYAELVNENARRGLDDHEYELLDTGVFDDDRYFDVGIEYAKYDATTTLVRLTVVNRGPADAELALLPTLVFRNTWSWDDPFESAERPVLTSADDDPAAIVATHGTLGRYRLAAVVPSGATEEWEAFFTDNDSNPTTFGQRPGPAGFYKDAFHRLLIERDASAVNAARTGTKAALLVGLRLAAGETRTFRLRLAPDDHIAVVPDTPRAIDACFARRIAEADAFYASRLPVSLSADERNVARQAYAGLLWTKQVYRYDVRRWLDGDATRDASPGGAARERNEGWRHVDARDVISMPDGWEYPWFASWDLAFHSVPLAEIDAGFAKDQLLLMLDERYQHPNGAIPAYEFGFGDANPPVHAMAVLKVYGIDKRRTGRGDVDFLERAFLRLVTNFAWWLNRNDKEGKNLFSGGFLGLDNIGLFDRNLELGAGTRLQQADATAWVAFFCAGMMEIAFELRETRPRLGELGIKFLHEFALIVDAINDFDGGGLWDEDAGFYFDRVLIEGREPIVMKVMSIVGLVPLFGIGVLRADQKASLPAATLKMIDEGIARHPRLARYVQDAETRDGPYAGTRFLAVVPKPRLKRLLEHLLDEDEFLSPFGIRSVSRSHAEAPFELEHDGRTLKVAYVPGEGDSRAFGGNSNWRGPVWFPINLLVIDALERYGRVYGEAFKVECPTGSGTLMTLGDVASELTRRLCALFLRDGSGARPCHGGEPRYASDPAWNELVCFNEYFHGDDGRGLGAAHQTGWTASVARCIAALHDADAE